MEAMNKIPEQYRDKVQEVMMKSASEREFINTLDELFKEPRKLEVRVGTQITYTLETTYPKWVDYAVMYYRVMQSRTDGENAA